ncbi:hypothetical protein TUMEXPCC7403_23230 [Tumidithrix helvetica PCC 7403]|uniref:hypothetical protein n=1 Tax=Tumidithrix helvetica TaxID=3457545 RepID=UPI003C87CE8B
MVQAISRLLTLAEFLEQYPEDGRRYEIIDGEIVEARPVGDHEEIIGLVDREYQLAQFRARGKHAIACFPRAKSNSESAFEYYLKIQNSMSIIFTADRTAPILSLLVHCDRGFYRKA